MILFFDTETTNFLNGKLDYNHPDQARVVQLGALLVDDQAEGYPETMRLDVVLDVGPEVNFSEGAVKIHGVTKEFSRTFGVNENAAYDIFLNMLEVADLAVAHNSDFDVKMIRYQMQRLSGDDKFDPFAGRNIYCTMKALAPILKLPPKGRNPGYGWPNLTEACRIALDREPTNAHNAIGDVIDCRDLFFWMLSQRQTDQGAE